MTRTLYLMRHAQASHAPTDRARPLSAEGRRQARNAGIDLREAGIELVLCSDATRTRQTLEHMDLKGVQRVEFHDALYLGSPATIKQRISEIEDEIGCALVVGHAPGIPSLAAELVWEADPSSADQISRWFPTAAYAAVAFDGTWSDAFAGGRLLEVNRGD